MSTAYFDGPRKLTLFVATATLLATVGAGGTQSGGGINGINQVAWALADQLHATSPYAPQAKYSYNSTGGSITIAHTGTGTYQVALTGFASGKGDHVSVTAYGSSSNYCNTGYWLSGNSPTLFVVCYAPGGTPADTEFTILYQKRMGNFGSASKGIAFLFADDPTNSSYTPDPNYQYNSTGGTNTVTRSGVGSYSAFLPSLTLKGGQVQVTAHNTNAHCYVGKWNSNKLGTTVNIQCSDASGVPTDYKYQLAYSIETTLGAVTKTPGIYALASNDTKSKYDANPTYAYNGLTTGDLVIKRTMSGEYSVTIPGSPSFNSSLVLVTGYNTGAGYCGIRSWSNTTAFVDCFDGTGTPKDAEFDVTYQTRK